MDQLDWGLGWGMDWGQILIVSGLARSEKRGVRVSVGGVVVGVVLQQRFIILTTVKNTQDEDLFGGDCECDHCSFFVVCDPQARTHVIALITPLRKCGQTFTITDDAIGVSHGNGR